MEESIGLSVGAARIAGQDRSMWNTLRPSVGQAKQWVSVSGSLALPEAKIRGLHPRGITASINPISAVLPALSTPSPRYYRHFRPPLPRYYRGYRGRRGIPAVPITVLLSNVYTL